VIKILLDILAGIILAFFFILVFALLGKIITSFFEKDNKHTDKQDDKDCSKTNETEQGSPNS